MPVSIINLPTSVVAISQERVKLSCKAKGLPKPLITWKRKDKKEMSGKWSLARGELIFEEVVPETQGKSLEEIEEHYRTKSNDSLVTDSSQISYFLQEVWHKNYFQPVIPHYK